MQYPLYEEYPAVYRDSHGEERTFLRNDGKNLAMTVRGVEFTGQFMDDFEPAPGTPPEALESFIIDRWNALCGYELEYRQHLWVVSGEARSHGLLTVRFSLGMPTERGGVDHETICLSLDWDVHTFRSTGRSGWFEDEMLELQAALPVGVSLKTCITCGLSDYGPGGHGAFGCLACFRDNKEAYRNVSGKADLFRIWGTRKEWVQETYHCPEFERRKPGTGYRG